MACIGDVYEIKNPLCGIEAEQGEADYGSDLGREVGVFDMVRHPLDSSPFAPRDQQSPPLRRPLAALDNSSRVAAAAGEPWKKKKRERDPGTEHARVASLAMAASRVLHCQDKSERGGVPAAQGKPPAGAPPTRVSLPLARDEPMSAR